MVDKGHLVTPRKGHITGPNQILSGFSGSPWFVLSEVLGGGELGSGQCSFSSDASFLDENIQSLEARGQRQVVKSMF